MRALRQFTSFSQKLQSILPVCFNKRRVFSALAALALMALLVLSLVGSVHTTASTVSHTPVHSLSQGVNIASADATPGNEPWP